jgi:hypothetical protein
MMLKLKNAEVGGNMMYLRENSKKASVEGYRKWNSQERQWLESWKGAPLRGLWMVKGQSTRGLLETASKIGGLGSVAQAGAAA